MRKENPGYLYVSKFDDESLEYYTRDFLELESDPSIKVVVVYISSWGGSVHNLLAFRDIIKSSDKPVATIALGKAMSAGAALLASGTKGFRFIAPNAEVLIHEVQSSYPDMQHAAGIIQNAQRIERLNHKWLSALSADTGIPLEIINKEIASRVDRDWMLSAEESLELGIVDAISIPRNVMSGSLDLVIKTTFDKMTKEVECKKETKKEIKKETKRGRK